MSDQISPQEHIRELQERLHMIETGVISKLSAAMRSLESLKNMHSVYNDRNSLTNYKIAYNTAITLYNVANDLLILLDMSAYIPRLDGHLRYIETPVSEW